MLNKDTAVLIVQGLLSVLLVIGALYLAVTGSEVPVWLVNLIVFVMGAWFAGTAVQRVRNNQKVAKARVMQIRQLEDGTWECVDAGEGG